jgi:hypothetical protein
MFERNGCRYGLLLEGDDVATAYRVHMFPTLYVIGPDGNVLFMEEGFHGNFDAAKQVIQAQRSQQSQ